MLSHRTFQHAHIDRAIESRYADLFTEKSNALRRISTSTKPADGRHSRIIPATDVLLSDQLQQFAFTHHSVGQIQSRELDLARMINAKLVAEPIVQRPVIFKLERTDRMRNGLDRIALTVSPIVHRIDAPLIAGSMMVRMEDAVHHRIAQVDIRSRHVDLGA